MGKEVSLAEIVRALEDSVSKASMKLPPQRRAEKLTKEDLMRCMRESNAQLGVSLMWIDTLERLVIDHKIQRYSTKFSEDTKVKE